ncbi:protein phosphatase 1D [Parasteatoda tepidariorum]|uniref:protein phosphatase 1D n=1 Tax=Parasteatoda tepidariorum TaxID=114398 RepID=UPI001C71A56C|nr:protein phosphatase 1D isoform X1 [Parasteatoda tepidariorum]
MSSSEINLRVTGQSSQGGRKYMEDAFVVAYQHTEDKNDLEYAFFGIFDGHGGKEAAQYAKNNLLDNIVTLKHFWEEDDEMILSAIRDGFLATHMAMWKEVDKWPKTASGLPSTAGTTASVAFIRKGKLYTGHVGDSRIVIGLKERDMDAWQAESLTIDHKPESPQEKQRIIESGGLVMNKSGVERVVWKRPRPGHEGPILRSTDFEKIPFLAVARSLGDLWSYDHLQQEFAVSPEPDLGVMNLDLKKDKCLILASDGLWNIMSPQAAVHLVQDVENENRKLITKFGISENIHLTLCNPSKVLVDCALERWNQLQTRADNVSVVTVMLDQTKSSEDEVLKEQLILKMNYPGSLQVWDVGLRSKGSVSESCDSAESTASAATAEESADNNLEGVSSLPQILIDSDNDQSSLPDLLDETPSCHSNSERLTNSPLQSCSNFLPEYFAKASRKLDADGIENSPCAIPRWSKNPSGRTSLSTLVTWSKVVSCRRMSDPFPYSNLDVGCSAKEDGECFSDEENNESLNRDVECLGSVHCEEMGFDRDTCEEDIPCTCSKMYSSSSAVLNRHSLKVTLNQLSSLVKSASTYSIKRKYSSTETLQSSVSTSELSDEGNSSQKRRACTRSSIFHPTEQPDILS